MATINLWDSLTGNPDDIPPLNPANPSGQLMACNGWVLESVSSNSYYPITIVNGSNTAVINNVTDLPYYFPPGTGANQIYKQDFTFDKPNIYTFTFRVSNVDCDDPISECTDCENPSSSCAEQFSTTNVNVEVYEPEVCTVPTSYSCFYQSTFVHPLGSSDPRSNFGQNSNPITTHIPNTEHYGLYNIVTDQFGISSTVTFSISPYRYLTPNVSDPTCGVDNSVEDFQNATFGSPSWQTETRFATAYVSGALGLPALSPGDRIKEIRLFNSSTNTYIDIEADNESEPGFNPSNPNAYANYVDGVLTVSLATLGFFANVNFRKDVTVNSSGHFVIWFAINDDPVTTWLGIKAEPGGSPPNNAIKLIQGGNTNNYVNNAVCGMTNGFSPITLTSGTMDFSDCSGGIGLEFNLFNASSDFNTVLFPGTNTYKLYGQPWFGDGNENGFFFDYNNIFSATNASDKEVYFNTFTNPSAVCATIINTYYVALQPLASCPSFGGGSDYEWFHDPDPTGPNQYTSIEDQQPFVTSVGSGRYRVEVGLPGSPGTCIYEFEETP
jgi:hypothetical protein